MGKTKAKKSSREKKEISVTCAQFEILFSFLQNNIMLALIMTFLLVKKFAGGGQN